VRLPDAKGLRDLHTLVANPGVEISAADLASGGVAPTTSAAAILDQRAKEEYRRRLDQLDDEIDRAIVRHLDDKISALESEREALLDELRRAAGLAGRDRRLNDESERMRKAVTARIRDSLRKLDDRHPALAAHLRASISTGAHCRYAPAEPVTWQL
jgi:exonuclease VII large subunit